MDMKLFLHALPAFERFSERQLDVLVSNLHVEEFAAGGQLITQGEQVPAMYILLSGAVTSTRYDSIGSDDAEPVNVHDGELFGLLSLADNIRSPKTCTAASAVTVPAPNNDGLLDLVQKIRRRHADPTDFEFAGRADRIAASELQLKATLLRAGVSEVQETAQSVATREHASRWTQLEMNPHMVKMLADRETEIAALGGEEITKRTAALREELQRDGQFVV